MGYQSGKEGKWIVLVEVVLKKVLGMKHGLSRCKTIMHVA